MFKLSVILSILLSTILGVHQNKPQNSDFDAMLKFAKYTTWEESPDNEFVILIAESDENLYKIAADYIKNQGFEDKVIKTIMLTDDTEITSANIIFIGNNSDINFEKLTQKIQNKHILTISTEERLLKEGCMFYLSNTTDKIEYLYNRQAVLRSGLMIKSSILSPSHAFEQ